MNDPRIRTLSMIVAIGPENIIGIDDKLPWHIPEDLKRFRQVTEGHIVIMGGKTFDSLGGKPLPNRMNVVLSQRELTADLLKLQVAWCRSVKNVLDFVEVINRQGLEVFVIGGSQVYDAFAPHVSKLYLTTVKDHAMPLKSGMATRYVIPGHLKSVLIPVSSEDYPDHTFSVWEETPDPLSHFARVAEPPYAVCEE